MLLLLHNFDLFFCHYMLSWGFLCGYFSFEYLKDTFLILSVYNFKTSSYCNVVLLYHSSLVVVRKASLIALMSKQRQRGCVNVSQINHCVITAINSSIFPLVFAPGRLCALRAVQLSVRGGLQVQLSGSLPRCAYSSSRQLLRCKKLFEICRSLREILCQKL